MPPRVLFKPAAEAELEQARAWYEERKEGLGGEFVRCVDAAMISLQRNPESYPVVYKQVRMVLVNRFPYQIFYTPEADKITVFSVFHAAKDPQIWKSRVL